MDKIAELDDIIARYDLQYVRPAGASIRSFLIECLAGPLVGLDPKHVHRFCDMYEHARHSYRQFGNVELHNYLNLLDELKSLVSRNTENKPSSPKKNSTPQHKKPLNRPKRKIASTYSTVSKIIISVVSDFLFVSLPLLAAAALQWLCTETHQLCSWQQLMIATWITVHRCKGCGGQEGIVVINIC